MSWRLGSIFVDSFSTMMISIPKSCWIFSIRLQLCVLVRQMTCRPLRNSLFSLSREDHKGKNLQGNFPCGQFPVSIWFKNIAYINHRGGLCATRRLAQRRAGRGLLDAAPPAAETRRIPSRGLCRGRLESRVSPPPWRSKSLSAPRRLQT